MAQAGVLLEQDQFNCSICLDVLKDPVTVPCGHSYCKACLKGYWDQDDYLGVYGCPQCRQSFAPRPVLGRNTMLADVIEKVKRSALSSGPPQQPEPEPGQAAGGDVECDVCTGSKSSAVRSCLVCLASYCESHLQPHYESAAFRKHRLTRPSPGLQQHLCPSHDRLLEVFCRAEQRCICYLCLTDEHRGHDTVLASAEMAEKKEALAETQRKSQQMIEEKERQLQELKQSVQSLTLSTRAALEESERIFTELVCCVERRRAEVTALIRDQDRAACSRAEELLGRLEQEISELKKRDAEMDRLAHTDDQISFLQSFRSVCELPVCVGVPAVFPDPSFSGVMSAVAEFRALLEDVCQGAFANIAEKVSEVTVVQDNKAEAEPETALPAPPMFQGLTLQDPSDAPVPTFGGFTMSTLGCRSGTRLKLHQRRRRR